MTHSSHAGMRRAVEELPQVLPAVRGDSVADRYLRQLERHGVQYLFGNAGTDFPPIIEAMSAGRTSIKPMLVPHENVAVAMAYGVTLATGVPQVVMVHVGIGTANALCGLFNASRQYVPMILTAGRTPVLERARLGARNNYINWAQEMFDQAGLVRELVKWDYELRDPAQAGALVDRAFAIAQSAPSGPVYLVLPREVLAADASEDGNTGCGIQDPIRPGLPSAGDLARCRGLIAKAERPLLITADAGRTHAGFVALTEFSQQQSIPVVQYRPRFLNLPCSASTHAGYDPHRWLAEADLILAVDIDVPWLPDIAEPASEAQIVHMGIDPLCVNYPVRGFRSSLSLQGDSAAILDALNAVEGYPSSRQVWLRKTAQATAAPALARSSPSDDISASTVLTQRLVSRCLAEAMDDTCILVNEYPFSLEELCFERAGQYYSHSPAGGLGWALGAAMGLRLAQPDRIVFAAVGDGSYMFGNPTPTHFVSQAQGLPFITVIYNNRRWAAVQRATLSVYPDGAAAARTEPVFATLEPAPDYECIVEACGGVGLRVTRADELPVALARAKELVRTEHRQVVINVLVHIDYNRSS